MTPISISLIDFIYTIIVKFSCIYNLLVGISPTDLKFFFFIIVLFCFQLGYILKASSSPIPKADHDHSH